MLKIVLQRVKSADVAIEGKTVGSISCGYLLFVGIGKEDTMQDIEIMADKISKLRLFEDDTGKINLSLGDVKGELLIISNFTLYADCKKRRPSFTHAAPPNTAKELYDYFCKYISGCEGVSKVETGVFGADMKVSSVNDGPVTIILDSNEYIGKGVNKC